MKASIFEKIFDFKIINHFFSAVENNQVSIKTYLQKQMLSSIADKLNTEATYLEHLNYFKSSIIDERSWDRFKVNYRSLYILLIQYYQSLYEIENNKSILFSLDDVAEIVLENSSQDKFTAGLIDKLGIQAVTFMNYPFALSLGMLNMNVKKHELGLLSEFCYLRCGSVMFPRVDHKLQNHMKMMIEKRHKFNRKRKERVIELYKNGVFDSQADAGRIISNLVGLTPRVVEKHISNYLKEMKK